MSFMFNPHPYDDPNAVNPIPMPPSVREGLVTGLAAVAKRIVKAIGDGARRVGIDMVPGTQILPLIRMLQQSLPDAVWLDTRTLALASADMDAKISPYLPEDRTADPALLYGVRFEGRYEDLFDNDRLVAARALLCDPSAPVVVYGQGALCGALCDCYDLRVWMDITPKQAVLNYRNGLATNFGETRALPFPQMMRRNYYVDFELGLSLRWQLIRAGDLDWYITASDLQTMQMLPFAALLSLFEELNRRPFRCRPVYLEGVWGGYYIHRLRGLPREMRNCAWVFDLIPMEVSLVAQMGHIQFETPFYTFVQAMGERLLGRRAFEAFGGYFPIRFNYDDTYHASGNMSIQCHPDEDYVVRNHRELGRQDESYYICVAGQGARTYLGFAGEGSCEAFLKAAEGAQQSLAPIDYARWIHSVPSVPGTQLMIPAGTVHASGRNQVILEIGSLTVGSYTYKLYDYLRVDPLTCGPRPIHLKMGRDVLRPERTAEWAERNLVNHGGTVREGDGWREAIVGEHALLYFSLRNLVFDRCVEDDTNGDFHVLALVDGECVRVESVEDAELSFTMRLMDIAVVPASFGRYRVVNKGVGTVTVHKTRLKDVL